MDVLNGSFGAKSEAADPLRQLLLSADGGPSRFEEGLASQLAEARQNAPDRIGSLVDLIDGLRQVKAQLIAVGRKTSIERYADALHTQTMKRSRRVELAASVVESKAKRR